MKKADLFAIVIDGRLITKKVIYDTTSYEVESVVDTCTFVETNEEEGSAEMILKNVHIKIIDYRMALKEEDYIYIGTVTL